MAVLRVLIVAVCLGVSFAQNAVPRALGEVSLENPAFMEIYQTKPDAAEHADKYTLFISTFNPFTVFFTDPVYKVEAPGRVLANATQFAAALETIDSENYWPNNPDYLPASVVGRPGITWTSGFLVPGKGYGALNLYFTDGEELEGPYNIAEDDNGDYSYHRVLFEDLDGDGDEDAITARFAVSIFGGTETQFVWLENPGDGTLTNWPQHMISSEGPDVHFRRYTLTSGGSNYEVFIVGEFFAETLAVYFVEGNNWSDINIEFNVERIVIDNPGQIFDLYIDDFNADGKDELLITAYDGSEGFVYVYEIPEDFKTDSWTRHTAADGFEANFILFGQSMTPGSPKPFYPSVEYANRRGPDGRAMKKWIALSGDDDGKLYILTPNSEDVTEFAYTKNILVDTGATTSGKCAVLDMDGDGYTDIIAAGYSAGKLYLFTYAPE